MLLGKNVLRITIGDEMKCCSDLVIGSTIDPSRDLMQASSCLTYSWPRHRSCQLPPCNRSYRPADSPTLQPKPSQWVYSLAQRFLKSFRRGLDSYHSRMVRRGIPISVVALMFDRWSGNGHIFPYVSLPALEEMKAKTSISSSTLSAHFEHVDCSPYGPE